jgi:hypothetical protein
MIESYSVWRIVPHLAVEISLYEIRGGSVSWAAAQPVSGSPDIRGPIMFDVVGSGFG